MVIPTKSPDKKELHNSKKIPGSPTENELHHLAFDNALQANIIAAVSNGKIITANTAACKLLGYSKKKLLTKNRKDIFDINDSNFKKLIKQITSEGKSEALITGIKKSGKFFPCQVTAAVFMDTGIEKSIITISDISQSILHQKNIDIKKEKIVTDNVILAKSKQKIIDIKREKVVAGDIIEAQAKSDARFFKNNEWIKYIAKTSYDVMWDWDIASGEIYVGDSIEEVFGYKVKNNLVKFIDFTMCLLQEEKDIVEEKLREALASGSKNWSDSYKFKRQDGTIASITGRASIMRNEDGEAIRLIGAIQDVSKLYELENKLEEQIILQGDENEKFLVADKLSLDVIWDWNILSNKIFTGEGFEELFGYTIQNNESNITDWLNHLSIEDREPVEKGLYAAIASPAIHWEHAYRFIRVDQSMGQVFNRANIFRHADGKAYRMIGVMQDISRQRDFKRTEEELMENNKHVLVNKIKDVIIEVVHYSDERLQINFSDHLSKKLEYDYTYLANLFSEAEGIPIQNFIISQKIERAKELIVSTELNLTKIARKLHYSSVAHLSNQFKKITGLTPSAFKDLQQKQHTVLHNV